MKNIKSGSMILTERDKSLFRYLFVNKVATVEDIRRDIFAGIDKKTVHRRLLKLSKIKLIEASGQREHGNRMVYFLTKKAFREHIAEDGVAKRVQLKSDCVEHDLALLEIKRKLRALKKVLKVYSENLVRSGLVDNASPEMARLRELHADAIVKLEIQGKTHFLPLEYEASAKHTKRNAKLLAKYYTNACVAGVIFISKSDTIERRMRAEESRGSPKRQGKFYYCLLDNVLNAQGKLSLSNVKNAVLSIV